jgi:putative endopeptidase
MIDGFNGYQRFFKLSPDVEGIDTNESLRTQAFTDPHPPSRFRVNGVVFNVPEFYKAFPSVKSVDKLLKARD